VRCSFGHDIGVTFFVCAGLPADGEFDLTIDDSTPLEAVGVPGQHSARLDLEEHHLPGRPAYFPPPDALNGDLDLGVRFYLIMQFQHQFDFL
jgi:hypothetical protein